MPTQPASPYACTWKLVVGPSPNSVPELTKTVVPATVCPTPGPPMSAVQAGAHGWLAGLTQPPILEALRRPVNTLGSTRNELTNTKCWPTTGAVVSPPSAPACPVQPGWQFKLWRAPQAATSNAYMRPPKSPTYAS